MHIEDLTSQYGILDSVVGIDFNVCVFGGCVWERVINPEFKYQKFWEKHNQFVIETGLVKNHQHQHKCIFADQKESAKQLRSSQSLLKQKSHPTCHLTPFLSLFLLCSLRCGIHLSLCLRSEEITV